MALTIQERIKDLRVKRGLKLKDLEAATGLSSSALGSYETEDTKDITHTAIIKLAQFYGVTTDYLLALTETKNHPNAELADLRLSDDMIEVLKAGRVDTALLGELVAHKDFMKLLADIDIYVNRVAAMQIHNLNAWVETVRAKMIETYQPGETDIETYLSDAVLLRERDYFTSRVHEDIDTIMEDIREAHRGRSESGPESSVIAELKPRCRGRADAHVPLLVRQKRPGEERDPQRRAYGPCQRPSGALREGQVGHDLRRTTKRGFRPRVEASFSCKRAGNNVKSSIFVLNGQKPNEMKLLSLYLLEIGRAHV